MAETGHNLREQRKQMLHDSALVQVASLYVTHLDVKNFRPESQFGMQKSRYALRPSDTGAVGGERKPLTQILS